MQLNMSFFLVIILSIVIGSVIRAFLLRAACSFHNYVCNRMVAEHELAVKKSATSSSPDEKWEFVPKYVEMPDYRQSLLIEIVARIVAGAAVFVSVALGNSSYPGALFIEVALGFAAITAGFCIAMSEPLEKGLIIAFLETLISLLVGAVVGGIAGLIFFLVS
jgi:hypothetical protein